MAKIATFAQRLREGLDVRNMTQSELASRSQISKSSISRYIKGDWEGKQGAVYALAQALGVTEAWLMGYDVPMQGNDVPSSIPPGFDPPPKTVRRPLIGDIACGEPITAEQNVQDYIDVPDGVTCDFCLRCHGDSMIDAGIRDRDIVYIRIQPKVEDGEIAAVRIGDEATLKRVYYDGSSITLVPANSAYRPKTYTGPDLADIQIEGKAVGFTHWF